MKEWIKKALTKTVHCKNKRGKQETIIIEPDERLVYGVKFAVGMAFCLSILEIAHIAFLGKWNSEIFAAITGLIGTVTGVFLAQKT